MVGAPEGLIARARAWTLFAALACAAGLAAASDEPLRVTGQCRDGHPQGGYALHSGGGRLRVQGAFNQGQRVGSFIFWTAAGVRIAHLPFDNDVLAGTDGDPPRKLEAVYRQGERHGETRSWYASGKPRAEYEYESGTLRSARAWSEAGTPYDEAAARALAERDRRTDADDLDGLLSIVRRHLPDCTPPPPQQRAALEHQEQGAW